MLTQSGQCPVTSGQQHSLSPMLYKWAASWQNQQNDCAPSEDSDPPGHAPSLIRFFAVPMKKHWVLSYPLSAQRRLWSDWADAQADLSLRWAHSHLVGFVMRRLKSIFNGWFNRAALILLNEAIILYSHSPHQAPKSKEKDWKQLNDSKSKA